jgi:hypothetical protein
MPAQVPFTRCQAISEQLGEMSYPPPAAHAVLSTITITYARRMLHLVDDKARDECVMCVACTARLCMHLH